MPPTAASPALTDADQALREALDYLRMPEVTSAKYAVVPVKGDREALAVVEAALTTLRARTTAAEAERDNWKATAETHAHVMNVWEPKVARLAAAEDKLRDREAEIERLRAEMPESLNTGNLVHDVRTLRMAHDSMHRHAYRWGKAALLLLPFVDMAAGEGLEWAEQDGGSPSMDAADLCAAFAKAMGCELGDTAYTAMMAEGQDAIRAALASTDHPASSEEASDESGS